MSTQRGFTLIEVVIAVAIVAVTAAAGVGLTVSSRAFAVSTAAAHFDALLDAARTTAHDFSDGATIVFAPDTYGDGTVARLYRNRPAAGPLVVLNTPPLEARVAITETESLHAAPFAIILRADGRVTGIAGYTLGSSTVAESTCPASGAYHIHFAYAGATADRYIPCHISLASTGPLLLVTPPPAPTPAPITASTACSGNCPGISSPTIAAATCPPGYVQQPDLTCKNSPLLVNTGQGWSTSGSLMLILSSSLSTLSFSVREDGYFGPFVLSSNCSSAATISAAAGSGNGPQSTYSVGGNQVTNCVLSIVDNIGKSASVNIAILSPRLTIYVCSTMPANTDLGPDPVTPGAEDFSDGIPCSSPTPLGVVSFTVSDGSQILTSQNDTVQPGSFYDNACAAPVPDWQTLYDNGEYAGPGTHTDTLIRMDLGGNVTVGSLRSTYYYDPGPTSSVTTCAPACGTPPPTIDPGPIWNWPPTWAPVRQAQLLSDYWNDNPDPNKGSDPNSPSTYAIPATSLSDAQLNGLPDDAIVDFRVIGIYHCVWDTVP